MFTNSAPEKVDEGSIHRHSDSASFSIEFPSSLLDSAADFARRTQSELLSSLKEKEEEERAAKIKIAVQLSDGSLPHSVPLMKELQNRLNNSDIKKFDLFILADNTFAPCCADQVTAQRNNAQMILHFGQTCFSKSRESIPVAFFVPPWSPFSSSNSSNSSLLFDLQGATESVRKVSKKVQENERKTKKKKNSFSVVVLFAAGISKQDLERFQAEFQKRCISSQGQKQQEGGGEKEEPIKISFSVCGSNCDNSDSQSKEQQQKEEQEEDEVWTVDGATFPVNQRGRQLLYFIGPAEAASSPLHQLALIEYWNSAVRINNKSNKEKKNKKKSSSQQQEKEEKEDGDDDDDDEEEEEIEDEVSSWLNHIVVQQQKQKKATSTGSTSLATTTTTTTAAQKDVARRINQRIRNVESLAHSSSVGLLVLSLSMSEQRLLLSKLQRMLRIGGKRVYVVFVGHLNEFKLANFSDSIDVFVSLACPNSRPAHFANKQDNFMTPLLFPAEVELWYARDVKKVSEEAIETKFLSRDLFTTRTQIASLLSLPASSSVSATSAASSSSSSSSTGNLGEGQGGGADGVMMVAPSLHIASNRSGQHQGTLQRFQQRQYQGLQPRYGEDAVQDSIVEGLSGIAKGYEKEG